MRREPSARELDELGIGDRASGSQDDERRPDHIAIGGHDRHDPGVDDRGMGHELALDIAGIDRPTADDEAGVDAIDDPDVAVAVHACRVSGAQPAIGDQHLPGVGRSTPVPGHDVRATRQQLAGLARLDIVPVRDRRSGCRRAVAADRPTRPSGANARRREAGRGGLPRRARSPGPGRPRGRGRRGSTVRVPVHPRSG